MRLSKSINTLLVIISVTCSTCYASALIQRMDSMQTVNMGSGEVVSDDSTTVDYSTIVDAKYKQLYLALDLHRSTGKSTPESIRNLEESMRHELGLLTIGQEKNKQARIELADKKQERKQARRKRKAAFKKTLPENVAQLDKKLRDTEDEFKHTDNSGLRKEERLDIINHRIQKRMRKFKKTKGFKDGRLRSKHMAGGSGVWKNYKESECLGAWLDDRFFPESVKNMLLDRDFETLCQFYDAQKVGMEGYGKKELGIQGNKLFLELKTEFGEL